MNFFDFWWFVHLSPFDKNKNRKLFLKKKKHNFHYQLHFASLVSPDFENRSTLVVSNEATRLPRRAHLKQSYLAFSWFQFLQKVPKSDVILRFYVLPSKRSLYTLQKAPMAHKTNSKEQFMFKFYFFKFYARITTDYFNIPKTKNEALAAFYIMRWTFPCFETNLLFLKYYQISSLYSESEYFNYRLFISKLKSIR